MIEIAGGVERLRPHMKTNKLREVVRMHLDQGITRFKCATIAEAEMAAVSGAPDVLLAYQPVGPNVKRFVHLVETFSGTQFAAVADDEATIRALSGAAVEAGVTLNLFLDLDGGMHRTGIAPGDRAPGAVSIAVDPARASRRGPPHVRRAHSRHGSRGAAESIRRGLRARRRRCAKPSRLPGSTSRPWSSGGRRRFRCTSGAPASSAAPGRRSSGISVTARSCRISISHRRSCCSRAWSAGRPQNRLCLDLGHKAVAAENPHPRVKLFGLEDATAVGHSEEHLVLETDRAAEYPVGIRALWRAVARLPDGGAAR